MNITLLKPISMKLQESLQYDPTQLNVEGKFHPIGDTSFIIVSNCIWVRDHIVNKGDTYFLIERDEFKNLSAIFVTLLHCFYYLDTVYLILIDTVSNEVKLLNHKLQNELARCQWKLVDTFTVEHMIDKKYNR